MMKLSIIIPYHKTLKELEDLLKVLTPQLTNECELCIVDDDVSTFELDKYKTDNINIIHHKQNSGCAGKPRNTGIDNTTGEYIRFIDADDMIPSYFIEKILHQINTVDFDYSIDSWEAVGHPSIKEVIIKDLPPSWNTCIWNGTYKRTTIGDVRFSETKVVAEDEEFNNEVRKGKRANITDIMYYYHTDINDSITKRYSRGEIGKEIVEDNSIKTSLLLYQKAISEIGGVEKFIYEFCNEFKDTYDITLVYSSCDPKQLNRLSHLVRCIMFNNQKFICDKYLCVSNQANIADNVNSLDNWYADMIHADYTAMGWAYKEHPKTNVHIAVSEVARQSFLLQRPNEKCEVIYNLLKIDKVKPVLKIISATRLGLNNETINREKGLDVMKLMAGKLLEKTPLIWNIFTDHPQIPTKGVSYMTSTLDIDDYIADAHFYVSTSPSESWGYSTAQALELGIPVVCMDYPAIHEQGLIDGVNGYIIRKDLSNLSEILDNMINKKLKIPKYVKKDNPQQWIDLLGENMKKKSDYVYTPPKGIWVKCVIGYKDIYSGEKIPGDIFLVEDEERVIYLMGNNPEHKCVVERLT